MSELNPCQFCGAGVLDYDKHTAWHRDVEERIANVDRNLSSKVERLAAQYRELDKRADSFGQSIDKIRPHFILDL